MKKLALQNKPNRYIYTPIFIPAEYSPQAAEHTTPSQFPKNIKKNLNTTQCNTYEYE